MAKGTTRKGSAEPLISFNRTETHAGAAKRSNPYTDYPEHIPGLLKAILCEIWELRQDVIRYGFFIGHKKDFEEFAEIYEKSVK